MRVRIVTHLYAATRRCSSAKPKQPKRTFGTYLPEVFYSATIRARPNVRRFYYRPSRVSVPSRPSAIAQTSTFPSPPVRSIGELRELDRHFPALCFFAAVSFFWRWNVDNEVA